MSTHLTFPQPSLLTHVMRLRARGDGKEKRLPITSPLPHHVHQLKRDTAGDESAHTLRFEKVAFLIGYGVDGRPKRREKIPSQKKADKCGRAKNESKTKLMWTERFFKTDFFFLRFQLKMDTCYGTYFVATNTILNV